MTSTSTSVFFLPLLLVISCTSNLPDYESMKKTSISEANQPLEAIREDITVKYDSLSVEAKLNLVMVDFAFQYPDDYEKLKKLPLGFDKNHLQSNPNFVLLCEERNVDTSLIKPHIYLIHNQP